MNESDGRSAAPAVTIVIVNYETSSFVMRCLESLREQDFAWEVVVVDNPSPAEDYRNLPVDDERVRVVRSAENVGYGPGCNLGAEAASAESKYICILNPDTAVPRGQLRNYVESYEAVCGGGGILGPALHNDNGSVQRSSYRFTNGLSYWMTHSVLAGFFINLKKGSWTGGKGEGFREAKAPREMEFGLPERAGAGAVATDWLMGAALLMDRKTWTRLGGFSDRYFMYSEDTDMCWRCHEMGLPVMYDTDVHIWHSQGDPDSSARERGIVMLFDGLKRFVDNNYRGLRKWLMYGAVVSDMSMRLLLLTGFKMLGRKGPLLQSRYRGYKRVLSQWVGGA